MSTSIASPEFGALPDDVKTEVRLWERVLESLEDATNLQAACRAAAARLRGQAGFGAHNIRRKFYEWKRKGQDWHILINRAKAPEDKIGLPSEFVEWFRGLCEQNQRGSAGAIREAIRLWEAGEPIPGYVVHPRADPRTGAPRGWSEGNLFRHLPSKAELKARRVGRTAARALSPLVFTTRVGLAVGQYYVFDDLWHDVKVNFLGVNRKAMRPLELAALDLYSGCKFAWGMKPMMEDEETQKRVSLKLHEMRFLLANVLINVGYRPEGTTLVVEHGTAAIPKELEADLEKITGGAVRVQRSGMDGAAAFAGAYAGRSKGNFRMKAALESHHALTHTELAALPGQMGANSRVNPPEEMHGREKLNDQLLLAMRALPDEDRIALLRMPFLEFNHFRRIASRIYEFINRRIEHDLEGWLEAGLIAYELIGSAQTIRRQSPREVFDAGCGELKKLSPHFAPIILGDHGRVERRVGTNGLFEFEDQDMGAGEFRYLAQARNAEGQTVALRDGEKYLTQVNPFDARMLFVSDAAGRSLGICPRWTKVVRSDDEALKRQMGEASHVFGERLAPMAARGRAIVRQRIEDTKHNAAVLGGLPVTPEEKERARSVRKMGKGGEAALDNLLNEETPPARTGGVSETATSVEEADRLLDQLTGE